MSVNVREEWETKRSYRKYVKKEHKGLVATRCGL